MSVPRPSRRGFTRLLGLCASALFCASISLLASPCSAQQDDQQVAEAARQEKARKAAQQKKETHVYTNEDLQQSQILVQQGRARVEARKHGPIVTPETSVPSPVDTRKNPDAESLGEVARRYRREKAENAQAAAHAAKPWPSSRFLMDLSQSSLAAPVQPAVPLASTISRPRQPVKPLARIAPSKRDPFSRQFGSPLPLNSTSGISPNRPAPARPHSPIADVAPHIPTVRNTVPPGAPKLLLPRKPVSPPPAFAPRPSLGVPPSSINRVGTIRIQPGDSLWKLARRHLGSGSRWNELLASNPNISNPRHIQPGTLLFVPSTNLRPRAQPPNSLTVQPGDSLWKLAASHLGSATNWPCLAQANPQLRDPNRLRPGQILSLPLACTVPPQP